MAVDSVSGCCWSCACPGRRVITQPSGDIHASLEDPALCCKSKDRGASGANVDEEEDEEEDEEDEEEETTNEGAQPCERRGNAERRRPRLPVLPGPFDPGSPLRSPGSTSDSRLSFFRLAASFSLLPSRAFFSALVEAPPTLLSRPC